ncbi:precorrin-4 C11-methyltransferase [Knoellia remsis]|uniref:Precorrin-4 C11-methyltransferase n=1 Tax=Knoellia remsis TaxID=407159 RepID=A0A2T0UZN5_9MICO|nr:precorrin-4 C(11)-methyltransferase [Knoellia remsis]PRY63382.1 precorrin-4 C11-methyltransferase [Knoellia remsis]
MTVHFIGAGPGAADLLTLRAVRLLQQSPVCLYAGTYLDAAVLAHCPDGAELVDTQRLDLDTITAHLVSAHEAGKDVARLCSGDPSVYSAIAEQTRRLDRAGVAWDVTPGVPAYAATAAVLGRELTVPEVAQTVVLTRAQRDSTAMPPGEQLATYAATGATLVLHLAIRHTRRLAAELAEYYGADCPVAVGSQVSQPEELILRGTLADIADRVEEHGLRQAAVIIVGRALGTGDFVESHLYGNRVRGLGAPEA